MVFTLVESWIIGFVVLAWLDLQEVSSNLFKVASSSWLEEVLTRQLEVPNITTRVARKK